MGGFGNKKVGLDLTEKGGDGGYQNLDVDMEGFCTRQWNLLQKMHRDRREHISFTENCKWSRTASAQNLRSGGTLIYWKKGLPIISCTCLFLLFNLNKLF